MGVSAKGKILIFFFVVGIFNCNRTEPVKELKPLEGTFQLVREFNVASNKVNIVKLSDGNILFLLNSSFGIQALNEQGETSWSLPGMQFPRIVYSKTDFMLGFPLVPGNDSTRTFYLVDLKNGNISDQYSLVLHAGEGMEQFIASPPYYFLHLRHLNSKGLFKKYMLLKEEKGRLVWKKEIRIPAFMTVGKVEKGLALVCNVGACNVAYPYQGVSDFESGILLLSLNSGIILNRLISQESGYISGSFHQEDSLIYVAFHSNHYNTYPFLELVIARYPDLRVLKRKYFPIAVSGLTFLQHGDGSIRLAVFNNQNGKLYFFNEKLNLTAVCVLNQDNKNYPIKYDRYKIVRSTKIMSANLDLDPGEELLLREVVYKVPKDPKIGYLENRRGESGVSFQVYLIDDDLKLLKVQKLGQFPYNSTYVYLPEKRNLVVTSVQGIKIYGLQ